MKREIMLHASCFVPRASSIGTSIYNHRRASVAFEYMPTSREIIDGIKVKLAFKLQAAGVDKGVIELNITGAEGGVWTIDCGKQELREGGDVQAGLKIEMADENFVKLASGELDPQTAFLTGKVKITGDPLLALKLGKILT